MVEGILLEIHCLSKNPTFLRGLKTLVLELYLHLWEQAYPGLPNQRSYFAPLLVTVECWTKLNNAGHEAFLDTTLNCCSEITIRELVFRFFVELRW